MRAMPGCDRLAVWTYEEAGEEIPQGDPWVTDAERAAAGRETLAERFAAVLPANRRRAAERYTAGGLPDGEDVARVWQPRDPAELRARAPRPARGMDRRPRPGVVGAAASRRARLAARLAWRALSASPAYQVAPRCPPAS